MLELQSIFQVCEWIGIAAFAVSGAMTAIDKGSDLFGVIFLSGVTALGGGTLRDILLGQVPPRMFTSYSYLLLALVSACLVFLFARMLGERYVRRELAIERINNIFDAVGLGVFAVSGARVAIEAGYGDNLFLTVFLGMTTAVGGGILRDVMLREIPFVLQKRIYAVAAICGALIYAGLLRLGMPQTLSYLTGAMLTVLIRLLATVFHLNLPKAL